MRGFFLMAGLTLGLAGCNGDRLGAQLTPPVPPASTPASVLADPLTGARSGTLRVMTWNVAGLPAPLKSGRGKALRDIGDMLGRLRAQGAAPHVLLIQEGFMDSAMRELIARAGYPYVAAGPQPGDDAAADDQPLRQASLWRGESVGRIFGAGLYILSDFPIVDSRSVAFAACAGFDCLANKGVMAARIAIPGAPAPVTLLNTHLNSSRSSHAPRERADAAHRRQMDVVQRFAEAAMKDGGAVIFGGDFNMRGSRVRWDHAAPAGAPALARAWCAADAGCDRSAMTEAEWSIDDSQDLLGFHDGPGVRVRPVRLAIVNDEYGPEALSDHSAYQVDYRITWNGPAEPDAIAPARRFAGLFAGDARQSAAITASPMQSAAFAAR